MTFSEIQLEQEKYFVVFDVISKLLINYNGFSKTCVKADMVEIGQ